MRVLILQPRSVIMEKLLKIDLKRILQQAFLHFDIG